MKRYYGVKPAMVAKSNYVHQFDSLPDGGSIGTAAPGDDDNTLAIDRTFPDDSLPSAATSPSLEPIPITHIVTDLKLIRSVLPRSSCN